MAEPTFALTEQLLEDTIPRKPRCGGKALTLLFLLVGLKLTVLLSQIPWTHSELEQHLAFQEPSITMALQPVRAPPLPQLARVMPFSQTAKAQQFMSRRSLWQSVQPVRRFPHSTIRAASDEKASTGTIVKDSPEPPADNDDALAVLKKKFGPLADLMKKYGPLALGFHFTVWSLTLGTSFTVLSFGLGVESYLPASLVALLPAGTGNLAAAYILTEATGPVRTLFTLGVVPTLGKQLDNKLLPAQSETQMQGEGDAA